MSRQNVEQYPEESGVSMKMKSDPRFTRIHNISDFEIQHGIINQIHENKYRDEAQRKQKKREQEEFNRHWDEVNK